MKDETEQQQPEAFDLTVSSAARLVEKCEATIREAERKGRLPAIRTGSGIRLFRASDVPPVTGSPKKESNYVAHPWHAEISTTDKRTAFRFRMRHAAKRTHF
jgi:hypothetical protein